MIRIFDHVLSPLKDNNLDETLQRFQRAGFEVDAHKVRHARGRLTGFARLSGTYLEFLSVVDEQQFNRQAAREDRLLRASPQPYGISADTIDAEGIHRAIKATHPDAVPVITSGSPSNPTKSKLWSICMLPRRAFPGANLFATHYHERKCDGITVHQGPNTIFALGGFTFCTHRTAEHQARWAASLSALHTPAEKKETMLVSRGQTIEWITPAQYHRLFGREYNRFFEDLGAIAVIKLLCSDLAVATSYLTEEGFCVRASDSRRAFFEPDTNTGYTFEVIQSDLTEFLEHYASPVPACASL